MFENFSEPARDILSASQDILRRYRGSQLDAEHLLLAALEQEDGLVPQILTRIGADFPGVVRAVEEELARTPRLSPARSDPGDQLYITPRAKRVLDNAESESRRLKDKTVGVEHLLLGILKTADAPSSRILTGFQIDEERVYRALAQIRGSGRPEAGAGDESYRTLAKYSRDLTQAARDGKLDPVIGRDDEITRTIQVLSRRRKNNPVLIGDPGVGKTAIAEGLAQKIAAGDVPETLRGKTVVALDLGAMVAGSKFRGEFEERLKGVMDDVERAAGQFVLFLDELHTVVGAGAAEGSMDASNLLKPALARGELQCVGATTLDEYRKYIEKDAALERRFQPIFVGEPSIDDAVEILKGLRPRYEAHHRVKITNAALQAAATLSSRYVTDRFLPDKAIDLIDEAAAKVRIALTALPDDLRERETELEKLVAEGLEAAAARDYAKAAMLQAKERSLRETFNEARARWERETGTDSVVDERDIAQIIARSTGIPVDRMLTEEAERLLNLERKLHGRVVGQERAIAAVSEAIRRSRAGLADPRRPIGSFLFLGPTGVGKTELAKALAELLFDDEAALVRLDMSEYGEKHSVARLIGAPPGYVGYDEGGQLTEAVRRRPYRVILLDEIEKAHPEVWNVLLQLLDDGRLTDGQGRAVNFKNTVILMTSNIGAAQIQDASERGLDPEAVALEELKRFFRPELLNRIDEVVVFHALSRAEIRQIVDLLLAGTARRLAERGMTLQVTDAAKDKLAEVGYDPRYGARPLKRTIQKLVENPIASGILRKEFGEGDAVRIDLDIKTSQLITRRVVPGGPGIGKIDEVLEA